MADILYGVKLLMLKEMDPLTQTIKAGGITCRVETGDEVELDPVLSKGDEKVLRTDNKILAVAATDDLLYGYNFKFKDNVFDINIVNLIEGGTIRKVGDQIVGYDSPMLADGNSKMKSFVAEIYVANYEGSSIVNYTKITLNNCKGKAPKLAYKKDFAAPEFEINAREATKAGKPIKNIDYVDSLPAVDTTLPVLTLVTVSPVTKPADVVAKSDKLGSLYLVNAGATIGSTSDLNALVNVGLGSFTSVNATGTNTNIPTTSLSIGSYKVYAVDSYGNISLPSTSITLN